MSRNPRMTLEEYGRHLADQEPPISDEQVEAAVRILSASARAPDDVGGR
jgi:hypothetical protein